jgi:hypothetical protein
MDVGPVVVFDFPGVLALCKLANDLADELDQYRTTRTEALQTALQLWRGPQAQRMVSEVGPAEAANLANGAAMLRSGAEQWAISWRDAQDQYNNREYAKAVKYEQDDRSGGEKFGDWFMGQDDSAEQMPEPPESAAPAPPNYAAPSSFVSYKKSGETWTMHQFDDVPSGIYDANGEAGWHA